MRTALKIGALVAVVGAIAIIALAGGALAYGGNAGSTQGMMGNHQGGGMTNGYDDHMNGASSGTGQCPQGYNCPMHSTGTAAPTGTTGSTSYNGNAAPATQTHCRGCC